jgi:ABC-2 type transport system permease protein
MQNILAIWQREMKSYFVSPVAYSVLTVFLFLSGVIFCWYMLKGSSFEVQRAMMAQYGQNMPMNVPGEIMRAFMGTVRIILLLIIPMLTMGLFAEEKKRGTMELLLTAPVGNLQAVIGKYLASVTFYAILLVSGAVTTSVLFFFSRPDWKPIVSGYLGLFLYGAAVLALGLFISALTESQVISVIVTFGVILFFWIIGMMSEILSFGKNVVEYLSITSHLDPFVDGVIDTSHIIFYLTFAFVGLFLAYRSLESMRWKG